MEISKEAIEKYKKIYEKNTGKKISDKEAYESASNLLGFFKVLHDCAYKDFLRKEELKKHPKGFHLNDGVYSCLVCSNHITEKESWYDELGPKCLNCQRAIDKKVIPKYVCKNRDSWYAMWQLDDKFGIKHQTARKMTREGDLKARIIKDKAGRDYFYVFLIRENEKLS